jgi:tRNA(fMet)-specific endonuclease VapC
MMLCDTNVLVDIDRGGIDEKVARLDDAGRHAISSVTVTELYLGVEKGYERGTEAYETAVVGLERLLSRFEQFDVTRPVGVNAARIVADLQADGERLDDLHDVYIAATARSEELPVLTANVDHFERIDDVRVVDWEGF